MADEVICVFGSSQRYAIVPVPPWVTLTEACPLDKLHVSPIESTE